MTDETNGPGREPRKCSDCGQYEHVPKYCQNCGHEWPRAAPPAPAPAPDADALVELLAKATPEPWVAALGSGEHVMTAICGERRGETEFVCDCLPTWALDSCALAPDHRDNLNLIIAMRTALPSLLSTIEQQARELAEAKEVIAWANNSLFGSRGFFLSTRGDLPPNPHHLDTAIEKLKADARMKHRAEAERNSALDQCTRLHRELAAAQAAIAAADAMRAAFHEVVESESPAFATIDAYDAARAAIKEPK